MSDENALIQAKLAKLGLDQTPEEFVEALPVPIKRRVVYLQELQEKHDGLEEEFMKALSELEAKYEKLYAPLYAERSEIITGAKDVAPKEGEAAGEDVKGVPEFWQTVLLKCDVTCDMIRDKDVDVLKYLRDVQTEKLMEGDEDRGFKLRFFFDANPYFSNEVLEKTYFMHPDDDSMLEKAEGTKIEWAQGKDVTVKLMKKKGKKGGKPQMKTEKAESFFNFFDPPQVPGEDEEVDEDTIEELQAVIEADYEVGATIREKLVPHAVAWYTGEAVEDEGPGFFLPGMGGDDDSDGEGEDRDGDEEGDAGVPGAGGAAAAGAPGQQPPECKQQ